VTAAGGVSQQSEFLYLNRDRSVTPLRVSLRWDPKDPFAVTLRFPKGETWVLARALIIAGLTRAAVGEGDVRFSRIDDCPDCVLLTLDSPSGHAKLHVPRADLIDFIMATEFVPRADPVAEFDFDAWLAQLRQEMAT
jgi:hypothetical protein